MTEASSAVAARGARWGIPLPRDPVAVGAAVVIAGGIAARAVAALGGFHSTDDFTLTERAVASGLTPHYLLTPWNDHFMPGGLATYWVLGRLTGLAYWPYVLLFMIGQTLAAVLFFRLSRRLSGRGWVPLVGLAIFQFAPVTMEITACVSTALMFVPAQIALVWALGAQERYVATRAGRHLVSLGAALCFGLCFFEKALTIVPLVFLFTVCLYGRGGPLRSTWQAVRDWWPSWAVLGGLSLVFLAGYLRLSSNNVVHTLAPAGDVARFFVSFFGQTLIPGLVGGPVVWIASGTGPTDVDTPAVVSWASVVVVAVVIAVTIARRPAAVRAWSLLASYAFVAVGLIAGTRLSHGDLFNYDQMPRFASDVVVVGALCLGVAVTGLPGDPPARPLPRWARSTPALAAAALVPLAVVAATVVSDIGMADAWSQNRARDYLRTAQAEVSAMPAGTGYFDRFVTGRVIWELLPPAERWQSRLLAADKGPRLNVVAGGEEVFVLDDEGHVRPIALSGVSAVPGTCLDGEAPATVALDGPIDALYPAVRVDYDSTADTTATVTVGGISREFPVRVGVHTYYVHLDGLIQTTAPVDLRLTGPAARLCVAGLTVGEVEAGPGSPLTGVR